MANSTYGFRTALGGFHKGDVNGYIEKMATLHRAELLEYEKTVISLQDEIRALNQQLNLLIMSTTLAPEPIPTEPAASQEPPSAELATEAVTEPVVEPAPEEAPISEQVKKDLMWEELSAYRRAEAVERNANRRAKKLYQQMEDLCDCTMGEFHTADAAVKQTIELIVAQAKVLEQAYATLSDSLRDSREKLASLNDQPSSDLEE